MYPLLTRLARNGATLGALALLSYCGGSDITLPSDSDPTEITIHEGNGQTASAGAPLPENIVVKVVDRRGEPVPGQPVAFAIIGDAEDAQVTPEDITDERGLAEAEWVLGTSVGDQSVVASVVGVDGLEVTFTATAEAAGAQRVVIFDGNGQSAPIGTALPAPLVVLVTDQFGNPVANVEVQWTADNGSVDPSSSTTGPDGLAASNWVLGSSVGTQTASASNGELEGSPVGFTATALPGSATSLVLVSGNNQTGAPGEQLSLPLVVRLVDRDGNGIPGRAVSWVVGAGGGTVASPSSTTGPTGEAEMRWTLGSPGLNTLNAVVSGVDVVPFRATAVPGGGGGSGSSPSRLEFRVQPSDTERKREISPAVEVAVLDQNGDLVTDREFLIMLELTGDDNEELEGDTAESTSSGIATFDDLEIDEEGQYRLRASTDGLPAVESNVFQIFKDGRDD